MLYLRFILYFQLKRFLLKGLLGISSISASLQLFIALTDYLEFRLKENNKICLIRAERLKSVLQEG